jgi:hypothetical protein
MANQVNPDMRPFFEDVEGSIKYIQADSLTSDLQLGDFVLCRLNAPLVSVCFDLIGAGKPATILGTDIGRKLVEIIDKVSKVPKFEFVNLVGALKAHRNYRAEQMTRKLEDERTIQQFTDSMDATIMMVEKFTSPEFQNPATNLDSLKSRIIDLFSEPDLQTKGANKRIITLMTIHKAKGLENNRVFVMTDNLPMKKQVAEEWRIWYVAVTRSWDELILVGQDTAPPAWAKGYLDSDYEKRGDLAGDYFKQGKAIGGSHAQLALSIGDAVYNAEDAQTSDEGQNIPELPATSTDALPDGKSDGYDLTQAIELICLQDTGTIKSVIERLSGVIDERMTESLKKHATLDGLKRALNDTYAKHHE